MINRKIVVSVLDGQGGKIGKEIVSRCKKALGDNIVLIALGTNAIATSAMVKGGADRGATGENAIVYNVKKSSIIIGTIGIIMPNSMNGELTTKMAEAVGESDAFKVLVPIERCNIRLAIPKLDTVAQYIDYAVRIAGEYVDSLTDDTQKGSCVVFEQEI